MGWVDPSPIDAQPAELAKWKTKKKTDHFLLQNLAKVSPRASKPSTSKKDDATKTSSATNPVTGSSSASSAAPMQWRILLKPSSKNGTTFLIAEAEEEKKAKEHWSWIEQNLGQKIKEVKAAKDKSLDLDSFLKLQFQMLFLNESIEEITKTKLAERMKEANDDVIARKGSKQFEQSADSGNENDSDDSDSPDGEEELLATIPCSLWQSVHYRPGNLLVHYSKIVFSPQQQTPGQAAIIIPFEDICSLTKETSRMGLRKDSLRIKKKDDQLFFSGLESRDDTYDLLAQLWNLHMESRLDRIKEPASDVSSQGESEISMQVDVVEASSSVSEISSATTDAPTQGQQHQQQHIPPLNMGIVVAASAQAAIAGSGRNGNGATPPASPRKGQIIQQGSNTPKGSPVGSRQMMRSSGEASSTLSPSPSSSPSQMQKQQRRSPGLSSSQGEEDMMFAAAEQAKRRRRYSMVQPGVPLRSSDSGVWQMSEYINNGTLNSPRAQTAPSSMNSPRNFGSGRRRSTLEILDARKQNESFRALFQLPADETLIDRFDCSLKMKVRAIQCKLYMCHSYACLHSLVQRGDREDLSQKAKKIFSSGVGEALDNFSKSTLIRGRRNGGGGGSGGIGSGSGSGVTGRNYLSVVIPYVEMVELGLHQQDAKCIININTKRNAFAIQVKDKIVYEKLQDLKNDPANSTDRDGSDSEDANSKLHLKPSGTGSTDTSPRLQQHHHAHMNLLTPRGKTLDWKDPRQWIDFFGEFKEEDVLEEKRKHEGWMQYFKEFGMGIDMIKTQLLDRLVYEGIPNDLRARMWQICSGSIYRLRQAKNFGLYDQFVKQIDEHESVAGEEIEKDLHRSFDHPYYHPGGEYIASLRRVLNAYNLYRPEIGYCQSMNIVTALLLLYLSEEEALWLLITVVDEMCKGYYTKEMVGSCVDQRVFEVLLQENLPRIHQHITEVLELPIAWFSLPWFLCLYIGKLDLKCVLRILDCFFLSGSCILFQVGLAMFKMNEHEILSTTPDSDDDMMNGTASSGGCGASILGVMQRKAMSDPENLFRIAFRDFAHVSVDGIKQLRNSHKLQVILDMEEEKRREREWEEQQLAREKARQRLSVGPENSALEHEGKINSSLSAEQVPVRGRSSSICAFSTEDLPGQPESGATRLMPPVIRISVSDSAVVPPLQDKTIEAIYAAAVAKQPTVPGESDSGMPATPPSPALPAESPVLSESVASPEWKTSVSTAKRAVPVLRRRTSKDDDCIPRRRPAGNSRFIASAMPSTSSGASGSNSLSPLGLQSEGSTSAPLSPSLSKSRMRLTDMKAMKNSGQFNLQPPSPTTPWRQRHPHHLMHTLGRTCSKSSDSVFSLVPPTAAVPLTAVTNASTSSSTSTVIGGSASTTATTSPSLGGLGGGGKSTATSTAKSPLMVSRSASEFALMTAAEVENLATQRKPLPKAASSSSVDSPSSLKRSEAEEQGERRAKCKEDDKDGTTHS